MVLRDLLVALVVARLALVDAVESERGSLHFSPSKRRFALRGLLGHLTGGDRAPSGPFVELDVFVLALFGGGLGRRLPAAGAAGAAAGGLAWSGPFLLGLSVYTARNKGKSRGQ